MKANELKKGMAVSVDGQPILIRQVTVQTASSRSGNTLYKVRGWNVATRQKFERGFKGDDMVESIDLARRSVQLLYRSDEGCTFMDSENYEQFLVDADLIEDDLPYITDGLEGIYALITDGRVLGIEIPATVTLTITACSPGMKGASASARSKPATLDTGLVVQVPEYLEPGDVIKVNTERGEYISRA